MLWRLLHSMRGYVNHIERVLCHITREYVVEVVA